MADQNPEKGQKERALLRRYHRIAGVDEVGRGCLAGPVYAAAVILDYERLKSLDDTLKKQIRDSKTLPAKKRAAIAPLISGELAVSWGLGVSTADEISRCGIIPATFSAMNRALKNLGHSVDYLLVDGNSLLDGYSGAQECVVRGDQLCYNIAAASILAKVARDLHMQEEAKKWPGYGFERHVGYGTREHLAALNTLGICELHRTNFAPIRERLSSS